MSSKIENPKIKQHLVNFAIAKLENDCELFRKTYGRNFVSRRLSLNLNKVYSNEKNEKAVGYYSLNDYSITICRSGENDSLLTVYDIQDSQEITLTALHEMIHAIFARTKAECKKFNIISGTGILETNIANLELGRGLNEGYTNWICEKAGLHITSYLTLVRFVKELELAIGEEKVMQFGKGGILTNIAKLLDMSKNEIIKLFSIVDTVYFEQKDENSLRNIINFYEIENKRKNGNLTPYELKEYEELSGTITQNKYYKIFEKAEYDEYKNYLLKNALEDNIPNRIKFLNIIKANRMKSIEQNEVNFESIVFEKYFKKEFEDIKSRGNFTEEEYLKFVKLSKLFLNKKDGLKNCASLEFQSDFRVMAKKYFENLFETVKKEIESGDFCLKKYEDIAQQLNMMAYSVEYDAEYNVNSLTRLIGQKYLPNSPAAISSLIINLRRKQELSDFDKYTIIELIPAKGNIEDYGIKNLPILFKKDDQIIESQLKAGDDLESPKELFNFTMSLTCNFTTVVNNFVKFKNNLKAIDPDATISILEKNLIVESNGQIKYYYLHSNEFIEMRVNDVIPIDMPYEEKKKDEQQALISSKKESKFLKFISSIRRKLFAGNGKNIVYKDDDLEDSILEIKESKNEFEQGLLVPDYEQRLENQKRNQSSVKEVNVTKKEKDEGKGHI